MNNAFLDHARTVVLATVFAVVGAAYLVTASLSLAQERIALTAIPPRLGEDLSLTGAPGAVLQTSIRVVNETDEAIPITTAAQDFIVDENGSTPIPVTDETSSRWSLASWLTLSPESQSIPGGEAATINVVINVPEDALPGGHYAMVTHTPTLESDADPTQSKITQRVGTLIYFIVEGPINEEAFVRNFEIPFFTEYGPVPYSYTIENLSDIHLTPQTKIDIYNWFGNVVETITDEPKNIFPFVPRSVEGQWDRQLGIGLYRAELTMSYGQSGNVVIAKKTFWLLPIRVIAMIALAVVTILVVMSIFRRTVVKRNKADKARIKALEDELKRKS